MITDSNAHPSSDPRLEPSLTRPVTAGVTELIVIVKADASTTAENRRLIAATAKAMLDTLTEDDMESCSIKTKEEST